MSQKKKNRGLREWIWAVVFALVITLIIRGLFFQSYVFLSSEMESTLLPGDFIVVNKIKHGPRLPVTLFSLPLFEKHYVDWIQLPVKRWRTKQKFSRQQLVVFNYPVEQEKPIDKRSVYLKRIVGLPGDTIRIKDKKLMVNDHFEKEDDHYKYAYEIISKDQNLFSEILDKYHVTEGGKTSMLGTYQLYLTKKQANELASEKSIGKVQLIKRPKGHGNEIIFPGNPDLYWNNDHFGPLVVPGKGIEVNINKSNIIFYREVIRYYEDNLLTVNDTSILINNEPVNTYQFKQDYFFVLDDNRDNAKDSRYWGFLPENHIIGTPSFVWFSMNKKEEGVRKIRWKRMFQSPWEKVGE